MPPLLGRASMLLPPVPTTLDVLPQLVANDGLRTLRAAIVEPERFAMEPKVDGVRGRVIFADGRIETRNRRGEVRQWLRPCPLETALRRIVQRLPILDRGTVLDGELVAERFAGTMAALHGSRRFVDSLRFVVFDVPYLAGVNLREMPWQERRERLELLAQAFEAPVELSPLVAPSVALVADMERGDLEGVVLKDRRSIYRDGSRAGWSKLKHPGWFAREAWRFER